MGINKSKMVHVQKHDMIIKKNKKKNNGIIIYFL